MSSPMRSLRMSTRAASRDSRDAPTARTPCVSTAVSMSMSILIASERGMTVSTDSSDAVVIAARASSAAYPSSPTERRIFADTRVNVRSRATPKRSASVAPDASRASIWRAISRELPLSDTGVDIPMYAPLCRGNRVPQSTSRQCARAIARTGELRSTTFGSGWRATGRRLGASMPRSGVACAAPASP